MTTLEDTIRTIFRSELEKAQAAIAPRAEAAPVPRQYLTVSEVAERTRRSTKTVRAWIKRGTLKASRMPGDGREWRVAVVDFEAFDGRTERAAPNTSDRVHRALAAINRKVQL